MSICVRLGELEKPPVPSAMAKKPCSMSFTWDPVPEGTVWIWVRIEERVDVETAGKILASAGPESYNYGESFALERDQVPNGDNRYVVAEVREGANPNLAVLYYGVSKPFPMRAGEHTHGSVAGRRLDLGVRTYL